MTTTKKTLGRLMATASVSVLGALALTTAVHAQDTAPDTAQDTAQTTEKTTAPAASDETVVVVTGQRGQLKSAQKIKKDSAVIVDSITAVDIGALPDRSVSEALQRISGLTLERTNNNRDPARLAVEGGNVQIRGLSWVKSETNGRDIFSANNGRALSFDDLSADLLAGVDVYKNPSASQIEGGIGGIVDLRTRLPFDSKGQVMAVSVDSNSGDLDTKAHTSVNGFYSNRWHTSAGEIGLLVDLSSGNVGNRTDSISLASFNATTIKNADGTTVQNADGTDKTFYIPGSIGWRSVTWNAKRTAATVALQYRPNEEWLFTLNYIDARSRESNLEYAVGSWDGTLTSPVADSSDWNYQFDSSGVLTSGTDPAAVIDADTRYELDHKKTADTSLNVKFTPNAKLTVTGDLQYVDSSADMVSMTAYTETTAGASISFAGLQSDSPTVTINNPEFLEDASNYYWAAAMDHLEHNTGQQLAVRLDADYRFDASWLRDIKVGVRSTDKHYVTRQTHWNWAPLSNQYWAGNPDAIYITDTDSSLVSYQSFSNFFHGNLSVPSGAWFTNANVVMHGTEYAYNLLKGTENCCGSYDYTWSPLASDAWNDSDPSSDNASAGVNRQQEKTDAIYAEASFGGDSFLGIGEYSGNFGLRYVQTESIQSGGSVAMTAPSSGCDSTTADCTEYDSVVAFASGTISGADAGTTDHKYSDLLPSFNMRVALTDQWQVRLGASRAMVRPDMSQMINYTTLSYDANATNSFTGTGGNPYLKPITADQYDFSAEYYFAPTGSFTFDLFDKELQNYIYTGTEDETYTSSSGTTYTFTVQRQFNGYKGSVKGFEVAYQQFYDFLPGLWSGFGVQANYTHLNSEGGHNTAANVYDTNQITGQNQDLPLEGMSPESYNLAVMYEKYGISARLAYNWRSTYLLTSSAANVNAPVWSEAYGQLDGSIFYSLNKNYKIGIQATNLTHSKTILDVSTASDVSIREHYSWVDTDRRIAVVLRASF
ncbi:MAG: TonB-dependent receptor [Asticcacaulis sp.]|uniref:TonB-dependent receptor n=1 Tax=Asticcacaulis sp. TaxID=1872648 RepID=UPI0039E36EFB